LEKFPQLFCLPRRHVEHTNFGTWGLANSIRRFSQTPSELIVVKGVVPWQRKFRQYYWKAYVGELGRAKTCLEWTCSHETLLVKSQICRKQLGYAIFETQKDWDLAPVKRALATVEILLLRLNQQSHMTVDTYGKKYFPAL